MLNISNVKYDLGGYPIIKCVCLYVFRTESKQDAFFTLWYYSFSLFSRALTPSC